MIIFYLKVGILHFCNSPDRPPLACFFTWGEGALKVSLAFNAPSATIGPIRFLHLLFVPLNLRVHQGHFAQLAEENGRRQDLQHMDESIEKHNLFYFSLMTKRNARRSRKASLCTVHCSRQPRLRLQNYEPVPTEQSF